MTTTDCGAVFSPCQRHRYTLWRTWDADKPPLIFVMLNPSTADETKNDPTVERCERRARRLGYGGVLVLNAYALRSTDPKGLKQVADPVGPANFELISQAVGASDGQVVVAWGTHINDCDKGHERRVAKVLRLSTDKPLLCLGTTKTGHPKHPLYIRNDQPLVRWEGPNA